ncbi:hypothetical protein [Streptomyces sp. V1I6]|uniref:hypothetical protein n=1 Tax=Streptomyces sp. V1I6 TaxID=3042273 RepID=UPI0027D79D25|nr:hypothetical protein [Streptomyces sp. V1I6]
MSITPPSLPVLHGRGGAVLTADREALVLDRPREQVTFGPGAVARVRAEGRTVTIELRARHGAAPTVYQVEDVSEAAAAVFTDGVNALLPDREDGEVDGTALTVVRSLTPTWHQRFVRRLMWGLFGFLVTLVAFTVAAGLAGTVVSVIAMVLIGGITCVCLGIGVYTVRRWLRERWLRRHGITVTATEAATPGAYVYMDGTGTYRGFMHGEDGPYVTVSYDPRDPADVLVPQAPHLRLLNTVIGSFLLLCSLCGVALLVLLVVDAFTGGEFSRGADGV